MADFLLLAAALFALLSTTDPATVKTNEAIVIHVLANIS
jgi:hypothetical protein